jgi:parallel beta-helix repeat protein
VEGDDFYFPTGYAQAATPNTITLDYNEAEEGSRFEEMDIEILSGTGSGQIRTITDYDIITSIATVEPNWIITPDVNSFYGLIVDCTKNAGGYPVLNSIAPPVDTDHDGMPDYWELALCLNPLNPADRNNDRDDDGYTNVEEYLNWLPLGEPIPVIFVDEAATGANDGSSWGDAYTSLQNALAVAQAGKNICVAQGTYKPAGPGGQRTATFQLINGVGIYGGYAGVNEPDPNARDVQLYETILSGDLDGNDTPGLDLYDLWNDPNRAENSYHVVTGSSTEPNAVLDGFTITAGNANGPEPNDRGGGMYNSNGSPTVTNCTFSGNTSSNVGGGIFDYNSSPTLTNCIFAGNSTLGWGGGMRNNSSSPTLINCTFIGNSASSNGGGMHNLNSDSPMITNCTFTGNSASGGGGIWDNNSSPIVTNCTFSGNSASSSGGGMYNIGNSNPTLTNCILWDNSDSGGTDESAQIDGGTPVVNYCCVQGWTGGLGGTGNIGDDPMFVDADGPDNIAGTQDDNLRLSADSNCIDAGDNTAVPADTIDLDNDGNTTELIPFDLNRFSRFIDSCTADTGNGTPPIVDMGAYEFLPSDIYSDGDVDFKDFSRFALYWLDVTCGACGGADLSCDGDVNRDDLRVFTDNWLAGVQ